MFGIFSHFMLYTFYFYISHASYQRACVTAAVELLNVKYVNISWMRRLLPLAVCLPLLFHYDLHTYTHETHKTAAFIHADIPRTTVIRWWIDEFNEFNERTFHYYSLCASAIVIVIRNYSWFNSCFVLLGKNTIRGWINALPQSPPPPPPRI